jgi:hypothetical protein
MSADRAYNYHEVYIKQFINKMGWLINNLNLILLGFNLGPLGLYKEIYNARDSRTWLVYVLRYREYRLSNRSN